MASATAEFKVVATEGSVKPKVDNVKVNPPAVKAGSRFNVSYRVSNGGDSTMNGMSVISFSCPGTVCIRDTRDQVRPVPPGGSVQANANAIMPKNAPKGVYKVTVTYSAVGQPGIRPVSPVKGTLRAEIS